MTCLFSKVFLLFAAFIWACGTSHLMDAMMFWWPAYRLSGVVHFVTAVVSWVTIGALVKIIPQALTLKTPTQLERIIEARTQELAAANAQISEANVLLRQYALDLERSNRELEQFATIASHDLQEPLGKMSLFSDRLTGLVPTEGQHYLDRLQNAATRMQALIQALLDFSRVNRKGLNLHETDLNEVIRTVLDDLQVSIRERRGAVIVGELTVVQGNSYLLHQLFQNLISNALKYQHDNRPPIIRLSGQRLVGPDGQPAFEVCGQDNGLGIPSEHFQLIFEPFERLANQNGRDGVGMGLAICKKS
jgi:two-component system, chemotaxis family, sensor kinase Cph1